MVTRSVISSSEQFSTVQRVEMITILFLLQLVQALPAMFAMFAKVSTTIPIKMNLQVSIGMLYISQSHVSLKTILIPLGGKDPNIWKKIIRIKIYIFEIGKVKVH